MTVLAEETAIREVWEETGVRAGNCVKDNVAYILLIPVICWNGSSQVPNVGFSSRFKKSVQTRDNKHLLATVCSAAVQIAQKYQVRGKSMKCQDLAGALVKCLDSVYM